MFVKILCPLRRNLEQSFKSQAFHLDPFWFIAGSTKKKKWNDINIIWFGAF